MKGANPGGKGGKGMLPPFHLQPFDAIQPVDDFRQLAVEAINTLGQSPITDNALCEKR
jgi:hypothetical protein